MPQWDSREFDKRATALVAAYTSGEKSNGASLSDLVTKVAKDESLNPEQIRRLCRITNVKTFETKFASMKGEKDRIVEFDPINAESIVDELIKSASISTVKQAEARYPDLRKSSGSTEKVASERDLVNSVNVSLGKSLRPDHALMRLEKRAATIDVELRSASHGWNTKMGQFSRLSNRQFQELEKDAMALYGEDVLPEINALREGRNLAPLELSSEKIAEIQDHLFAEESELTKLVKSASVYRQEFLRLTAEKVANNVRQAALRKEVLGG